METLSKEKIIVVGKKDITLKGSRLYITYKNKTHSIALKELSPLLNAATPAQRKNFEVSASGYGIHWPEIDEDLSVGGILRDMKVL